MGAEASLLSSCKTDPTAILNTPEWSMHDTEHREKGLLSVFIDDQFKKGAKLEKLAHHLRQFRHPSILHYVAWCETGGSGYLFTERANPLSSVRSHQEELAICLGLQEVIQALSFLHSTASVSHNNISQDAVFISPSGRWKLGGLEGVADKGEEGRAKDVKPWASSLPSFYPAASRPAASGFAISPRTRCFCLTWPVYPLWRKS